MIFRNFTSNCRGVFSNRFDPRVDIHRRHRRDQPAVASTAGAAQRRLTPSADPDWQTVFLPRSWHNRDVLHGRKFSFERDIFFCPQAPHKTDRLVRASRALFLVHAHGEQILGLTHRTRAEAGNNRPRERKSSVASSLARTIGLRVGSTSVLVPSFILRKWPAM